MLLPIDSKTSEKILVYVWQELNYVFVNRKKVRDENS